MQTTTTQKNSKNQLINQSGGQMKPLKQTMIFQLLVINYIIRITRHRKYILLNIQIFISEFDFSEQDHLKANEENDYIKNFKTLSDAFSKLRIQKQLDIQSLSKSKYKNILDITQYLKSKFDKQDEKRQNYDPLEFRKVEDRKVFAPTNRKTLSILKDKTNNKIPQPLLIPYQLKDLLQVAPLGKIQKHN
ncbi:unnamed protein product (macronuclear) [Paramecium tetraurelia]|uniref:Uncharacterized protein n=1 Tax=Paramecium tetraurelia TaxID=5888 RepID=A0CSB8_PARTE|nr:uncharacterized protein GSPATT00009957001 [Paramecium tetraurelia]CAK73685.1 unnamed protein product [Paramecium tetraurelia]|eukprot:XP_001441082.1 hypothetical protein (macronuclear) [Paramecium tetraurelia strain d4-2]